MPSSRSIDRCVIYQKSAYLVEMAEIRGGSTWKTSMLPRPLYIFKFLDLKFQSKLHFVRIFFDSSTFDRVTMVSYPGDVLL